MGINIRPGSVTAWVPAGSCGWDVSIRALDLTRHITTGHLRDEPIQVIDCNGN